MFHWTPKQSQGHKWRLPVKKRFRSGNSDWLVQSKVCYDAQERDGDIKQNNHNKGFTSLYLAVSPSSISVQNMTLSCFLGFKMARIQLENYGAKEISIKCALNNRQRCILSMGARQ